MNLLITKDNADTKKVYPITYIEAIYDKSSKKSLSEILLGVNHFFLSYTGYRLLTRLSVPKIVRRKGIWISYVLYTGLQITEYYTSDSIEDRDFKEDSNWNLAYNYLITVEDILDLQNKSNKLVAYIDTDSEGALELTDLPNQVNVSCYLNMEYFGDKPYDIINPNSYNFRVLLNGQEVSSHILNDKVAASIELPNDMGYYTITFKVDYNGTEKEDSIVILQNIRKYFGFSETRPTNVQALDASHLSNSASCTVTIPANGTGYKYIYFAVPYPMVINSIAQPNALNAPLSIMLDGTLTRVINGRLVLYNLYRSRDKIDSSFNKKLMIL